VRDPRTAETCHCGRDEIGHVHTRMGPSHPRETERSNEKEEE